MDISFNIVGKGTPIIFIHGVGSRKYSWNGIIRELENNYKCIAYDLRSHGNSIIDNNKFTINDLVDDLEKLRSHLNINKVHIVGHSLGGMIGSLYVRKYQERVFSLTLLSTAAFRTVKDREKLLLIIKKIENESLDNVIPNLINRWFTDDFIKKNQEIINERVKQIKDTPLKAFLNVFRLYALTEMSSWLNEISVPSLVITGENDEGCNPLINRMISNALPNSKLEILNNLRHAITLESPQLVSSKMIEFFRSL